MDELPCVYLPVAISATSVHELPFQDSVLFSFEPPGVLPPKFIESVLLPPLPVHQDRAVFKSPTSVHEVPFQDSTTAPGDGGLPPTAKA